MVVISDALLIYFVAICPYIMATHSFLCDMSWKSWKLKYIVTSSDENATLFRLGTSDSLLHQIQEKIKWADTMSDVNKKHQKEFEDRVEEAKKSIKVS